MTDTGLKTTQQQSEAGQVVFLYQLDVTPLGGTVLYFTSTAFESSAVIFDSQVYAPINVEADGFDIDSDGSFPTPTLRVSNVEFTFQSLLYGFNDLIGAEFTRIRTFRKFLDGGSDPDPTARFPDDVYIVNRKTQQNKIAIEWELKSSIDHEDKFIPGRQILKNSCSQIYRIWTGSVFDYTDATCPYTGSSYFDISNITQSLPANDQCGKRLSSCRLRFGENAVLPFGGFPGVRKISA